MPTLAVDVGAPYTPAGISLAAAQAGNGASTNIVDRGGRTGPGLLQITTTVGATPTCTYLVEGSADGTTWFAIPYTDPANPGAAVSVATFVITAATVTRRYLQPDYPWRYLRVTMSANTNVTSTIDAWFF